MNMMTDSGKAITQFFKGFVRGIATLPFDESESRLVEDFDITCHETEAGFELTAHIPGMNRQDIHLAMEARRVHVCASLIPCKKAAVADTSICTEACYASALHTLRLPAAIDVDRVEVSYEQNVLRLVLPRKHTRKAVWLAPAQ